MSSRKRVPPQADFGRALQQLRAVRPLGVDKTLTEIWHFRLKGAPEAIYRRALGYRELHDQASAPYRQGGNFAWHFARGKLGYDPAFRGIVSRGLTLAGWVEADGDITMPELAARLLAERGVKAHPASLSRLLIRQGFTVKKNAAGERNRSR